MPSPTVASPSKTPPPDLGSGPGTELVSILADFGAPTCQQCYDLARRMNLGGPQWCRDNINSLIDDILPRAQAWFARPDGSWADKLKAAAPEFAQRAGIRSYILKAIAAHESKSGINITQPPLVESIKISPDPLDSVTACVTEFLRPAALERLLASLRTHFPSLKVDVEPTGGNLCRARNVLTARCRTPFYLMLEEDFEVHAKTDIHAMLDVLADDPALGGVTAITHEPKAPDTEGRGSDIWWHQDFRRIGNRAYFGPPHRAARDTASGVRYQPCDVPLNFGLFRTQLFRDVPWDENLPVGEFGDYYWRVYLDGRWSFACVVGRPQMVLHHRDRPGPEYNQPRRRNLRPYLAKKFGGLEFITRGPNRSEIPQAPNVIFLTIGRSNSTITTKMAAQAFGLHLGDADDAYAESVSVRRVNQNFGQTGKFDTLAARRALRRLPEPWIIKDPRFKKSLPLWLPELARYKPLLCYVHKDPATTLESFKRAGWGHLYDPEDAKRCERLIATWPYRTLTLRAEDVAAAALLFDPSRLAAQPA